MYKEYFGFEEMPFSIAPDPRYLYMSEQHREALAHLLYGFNSDGGFVLLTGDIGTGKTTVCRCLLGQIPENSAVAFIINPKLTVEELLATICDEFDIRYPAGNTSIKVFIDLINEFLLGTNAKGHKCLLIIDEAQNLSADVLEQLRLLTNLETNQYKLLHIMLIGQPELRDKLAQPELTQLAQRIIARYHLGPLPKKDIFSYVAHRLSIARMRRGAQRELFPSSTVNTLYQYSNGIPRLINIICDRALLGTYVQGRIIVSKTMVKKAAKEVFGEAVHSIEPRRMPVSVVVPFIVIFLFLAGVLGGTYFVYDKKTANKELQNTNATVNNTTATQAETTTQTETTEQPQTNMLAWPIDKPVYLSKDMAFQSLFKQWGIIYEQKGNITACEQAQAKGLHCLNSIGTLSDIKQLNKPSILRLFNENGAEFYAVLISLNNEAAMLAIAEEIKQVAIKDIETRWKGEYTLLWKAPPGYRGYIQPGDEGKIIEWLDKQLSRINAQDPQPRENPLLYDEALVKEVKKFQLAKGLFPDGVVGTKTLIYLNSLVDSGEPRLDKQKHAEANALHREVKQ
ncbi:MAG: AAA family ATPase [Nitrospirae bacterium]|nr:AAA family ATPase [Nitrospirota bacterium]